MIALVLIVIAGMADGVRDTIEYHWYNSIFQDFKNGWRQWFDPAVSHLNKYKDFAKSKGPRFPGSTTMFVWTTDAWHFFQMIRLSLFTVAIVMYEPIYHWIVDFILLKIAFSVGFHITYSWLLLRKKS